MPAKDVCLARGLRSVHNAHLCFAVVTVIHVLGIFFVIVAGMTQANTAYAHPFAPFGARGIFDGATTAFFAFIGADALANTAEEVRPPTRCILATFWLLVRAGISASEEELRSS